MNLYVKVYLAASICIDKNMASKFYMPPKHALKHKKLTKMHCIYTILDYSMVNFLYILE